MGGAFGALGGNLSAISSNPASGAVFELSRFGGSLVSNINQTGILRLILMMILQLPVLILEIIYLQLEMAFQFKEVLYIKLVH